MAEAIALVGCKGPDQEAEYLRILSAAMPEERLLPFPKCPQHPKLLKC